MRAMLVSTLVSTLNQPGPATVLRPRLPNVNDAGLEKAAVLTGRAVLRWLEPSWQVAPGTALARTRMPPVPPPIPVLSD